MQMQANYKVIRFSPYKSYYRLLVLGKYINEPQIVKYHQNTSDQYLFVGTWKRPSIDGPPMVTTFWTCDWQKNIVGKHDLCNCRLW